MFQFPTYNRYDVKVSIMNTSVVTYFIVIRNKARFPNAQLDVFLYSDLVVILVTQIVFSA